MKILKANKEQYETLNGHKNGNSVIQFAKDGLDNWIIGKSVLNNAAFDEIKDQLLELQEIDFVPVLED